MALRMLLAGSLGFLLVAALAAQSRAQDPVRSCTDLPLPFDLVSNFEVVVRGQIGNQDGLKFILDTGSSYSVIDRRVADKIGLRRDPGSVFNYDRDVAVEWAEVPEVRIGPMHLGGMRMMVARLADLSELADRVDGIIGLDVLSRAEKIGIDYERRTVSIELEEGCASRPSAVKAFLVTMTVQGVPMRLMVDTGLQYILLYKDRLSSAIPHLRTEGEPRNAMFGRLQATRVNLPGVQVLHPEAATAVFLIEKSKKSDLGGIDGFLGPASLHARRVELDFAAMTLRLQ